MRAIIVPAVLARGALAVCILLAPFLAFGQEATGIPAPYVSRLTAESAGSQVKLTWKDSADVVGTCLVYRHAEQITAQSLASARMVARVPSGAEYYLDSPPGGSSWFYAVLVEDSSRRLYPVLIPFRNTTTAGVAAGAAQAEGQPDARVTDIRASVSPDGQGVELTFRSTAAARDLIVFWGTSPMTGAEDLLHSTSKAQIDAGQARFTVPALAGVDYYFALLDAQAYKLGRAHLAPGENMTVTPFQVPIGQAVASFAPTPARRAFPLPSMDVGVGVQSGQALEAPSPLALPAEKPLGVETSRAIQAIRRSLGPQGSAPRRLQLLASEATPAATEEGKALQAIVKGPFTGGDMSEAERQLRNFLSLNRTLDTEARARFYLGQALYFQGRLREAFLEFLVCEDVLYIEASGWKNACLAP